MTNKKYVLITAVKNEANHIEKTIISVLNQTIKPMKWVIISDNSTDTTDQIVRDFEAQHKFIHFIRKGKNEKGFISKVNAVKMGWDYLKNLDFDFIGNLDGDVTFEPDYFEQLLEKFVDNEQLGIGGGIIWELINNKFRKQVVSLTSVAGAVQLFRHRCYKEVGGYLPLPYGGEDATAEVMARMNNWQVRTFQGLKVKHYGVVGNRNKNIFRKSMNNGKRFYYIGYSLLFEILRLIKRLTEYPYIIGSIVEISMFLFLWLKGEKRQIPEEVVAYLQKEQLHRILKQNG